MPGSRQNSIEVRSRTAHPSTPPSGYVHIYRMADDGSILYKDSAGNIRELTNLALESLVAALSGKSDSISGDFINAAYVASISANLQTQIDSVQTSINNLDLTYATDAAVAATSAYLQSEIDALSFSGVTEAELASLTGYLQGEIDTNQTNLTSLQTQVNNLDLTYATDAAVAATSAYIQNEINNLSTTYATDAEVLNVSASLILYLPAVAGSKILNTVDRAYTVTDSKITFDSIPQLTLSLPTSGSTIYALSVTNVTSGSFAISVSDVPSVSGYSVNYIVYNQMVGIPITQYSLWDSSNTFGGNAVFSNSDHTVAIGGGTNEHIVRTTISKSSGKWAVVMSAANNAANAIGGFQLSSLSQDGDFVPHGNTKRGFGTNGDRWLFLADLDTGMITYYQNEVLYSGPNPLTDWFAGASYFAATANLDHLVTAPAVTIDTGEGFTAGELSIISGYGANPGWYTIS